jgi:hypothetical protein
MPFTIWHCGLVWLFLAFVVVFSLVVIFLSSQFGSFVRAMLNPYLTMRIKIVANTLK